MGLSKVYEHFEDEEGNLYFPTEGNYFGVFIRQVQTKDGETLDASQGLAFVKKMISLGFKGEKYGQTILFGMSDNWDKFKYRTYGSETGIPNERHELK